MQEAQVGRGIEDRGLLIVEAGLPEVDRAQNLHTLPFSGDGNFRGMAHAAPSGVEGGVLAETGFVGKNQGAVPGWGFFLRRG
jgi:hypothetical protein